MTERFDPNREFGTWYYKTDPTHVFLYPIEAFEWIQQHFCFNTLVIENRVVVLGM
jgi:hypothetical protein